MKKLNELLKGEKFYNIVLKKKYEGFENKKPFELHEKTKIKKILIIDNYIRLIYNNGIVSEIPINKININNNTILYYQDFDIYNNIVKSFILIT